MVKNRRRFHSRAFKRQLRCAKEFCMSGSSNLRFIKLEQISKSEILRKLKQCFGSKTIRDVRFRVG